MIKYLLYISFILCSGCFRKLPSKPTPITNDNFNSSPQGSFAQKTIAGNSSIDYSEPLFIFILISSAVFIISFFPLFAFTCKWFYKKILTLFKK